jgi:hypothetical protein
MLLLDQILREILEENLLLFARILTRLGLHRLRYIASPFLSSSFASSVELSSSIISVNQEFCTQLVTNHHEIVLMRSCGNSRERGQLKR